MFLSGLNIAQYTKSHSLKNSSGRLHKLLLHKVEIKNLIGLIKRKNYTVVPLLFYFNKKDIAKILLGIARGKKKYDKRDIIKKRDSARTLSVI